MYYFDDGGDGDDYIGCLLCPGTWPGIYNPQNKPMRQAIFTVNMWKLSLGEGNFFLDKLGFDCKSGWSHHLCS